MLTKAVLTQPQPQSLSVPWHWRVTSQRLPQLSMALLVAVALGSDIPVEFIRKALREVAERVQSFCLVLLVRWRSGWCRQPACPVAKAPIKHTIPTMFCTDDVCLGVGSGVREHGRDHVLPWLERRSSSGTRRLAMASLSSLPFNQPGPLTELSAGSLSCWPPEQGRAHRKATKNYFLNE